MRETAQPSGQLPPQDVRLRDGGLIELVAPATAASERHLAAHPDERERYAPHAQDWCGHDLQWLLFWAVLDADDQGVDLAAQVDWLARVLRSRDYPLASLADALETLADEAAAAAPAAAERLRVNAARVRP